MSEIKRFSAYSDHMTVALIRGANFPKPVSVNYQEEWKRGLVSEFLAIQLLCIPQVTVDTIQRDITEWELKLVVKCGICQMRLSFTQSNCIIVNSSVDSHSEELKYRFGELVQLGFFGSAFVYTHVMFMALESDLPTVQLKSEFKQKVLYMSEKYI